MRTTGMIEAGYEYARQVYAEEGIDVERAIDLADRIPISIHNWQGDDLIGFDGVGSLTGGIATTGNYPGRARNAEELRQDLDVALSLIPGKNRVNLHASYAEGVGKGVDRDAYTIDHFLDWVSWAKDRSLGLDFNPTFFSHPKMDGNFSLASGDESTRRFWIEHGKRCREIGEEFGRRLKSPCIVNFWMPDGYKDIPADTLRLRTLMVASLDEIFAKEIDRRYEKDALESKLFGLGLESYTVASHEFSLGYALSRKILYTLDAGHFHPTEMISQKFTAILQFADELLLHVSRGVRWDSDHVVVLDDALQAIMDEIVHNDYEGRVHIGLDYFDASINRLACWIIGTRNARKALLRAALTPVKAIREMESSGDYTSRLALGEESKSLPFGPVWDYYCLSHNVGVGDEWLARIKEYERKVLVDR